MGELEAFLTKYSWQSAWTSHAAWALAGCSCSCNTQTQALTAPLLVFGSNNSPEAPSELRVFCRSKAAKAPVLVRGLGVWACKTRVSAADVCTCSGVTWALSCISSCRRSLAMHACGPWGICDSLSSLRVCRPDTVCRLLQNMSMCQAMRGMDEQVQEKDVYLFPLATLCNT